MKRNQGFTIVELMIVVAILGVLAAVAVPMYNGYVRDAERAEAIADLQTIRLLEEQNFSDAGGYAAFASAAEIIASFPAFNPKKDKDGNVITAYEYSVTLPAGGGFSVLATHKVDGEVVTLTDDNRLIIP